MMSVHNNFPHHSHRIEFFIKSSPSSDNCPVAITSVPKTHSLAIRIAKRPRLPDTSQALCSSRTWLVGINVWRVGEGGGRRVVAGGGVAQLLDGPGVSDW